MTAKKKLKKKIIKKVKTESNIYLVFNNASETTVPSVTSWLKSIDERIISKTYIIPAKGTDGKQLEKLVSEENKLQVISSLSELEYGSKDHIVLYNIHKAFCTIDIAQVIALLKRKQDTIRNIRLKESNLSPVLSRILIFPAALFSEFTGIISDSTLSLSRVIRILLRSFKCDYEETTLEPNEIKEKEKKGVPGFLKALATFKFILIWYYIRPFKNIREQFSPDNRFEPAIYRGIFVWFITLLLFVFPLMSRKAGISGDEVRHYEHAGLVYNYFASHGKDTAALNTPKTLLHYYGQSFDNISYILVKTFNIENVYEFRHFLNSLVGWLAVLFTGLLASLFARWRGAILASLLIFLSPRFLGHALNNPVDIPFATAGIISVYYMIKLNTEYPRLSFKNLSCLALGIGMAISIRIGGVLYIAFAGMFTGLNFIFRAIIGNFTYEQNKKYFFRLVVFVSMASIAGYFIGQILWPYALQDPVHNPMEAMKKMTNIENTLRQLFEGKFIWSDAAPWYYSIKYMLYTIPVIVFAGVLLIFIFLRQSVSRYKFLNLFILLFSFVFPVFYIIHKQSNVYGGWRHLTFIYPTMVVFAALGIDMVLQRIKQFKFRLIPLGIILLLLLHPALHIIRNYPHHYIYYNQIIGGIKGAFGKYETDYYFHSFRAAAEWLKENKLKDASPDNKKIVLANAGIAYHFKDVTDKVIVDYNRYYRREEKNWDYGIFANSYIAPYQMKNKIWPPKGTIHTIDIDGYPICAIVERKDRNDFYGTQALRKKEYNEAIYYLNKAIQYDPMNEQAYVQLSRVYLNVGRPDDAIAAVDACMKSYPNYDVALGNKAIAYMFKGEFQRSIETLDLALQMNSKFKEAYYYKARCYYELQDFQNSLLTLDKCLKVNPNHKESYLLAARIYEILKKPQQAQYFRNIANSLP